MKCIDHKDKHNYASVAMLERIHKINFLSSMEAFDEIEFPRDKRRLLPPMKKQVKGGTTNILYSRSENISDYSSRNVWYTVGFI